MFTWARDITQLTFLVLIWLFWKFATSWNFGFGPISKLLVLIGHFDSTAIWLDAHPATCQIAPTTQSSNHVVELYAQHNLQVYNPINFFKVPPHPQLEASINCTGHPHPILRYCDKVTLIVALGFIFFYLDLLGEGGGEGGGGRGAHKVPRLLCYPISSHASPSHVIYHQGGHSSLFHHEPLGLCTSFLGIHLSTLCVYYIFPFS